MLPSKATKTRKRETTVIVLFFGIAWNTRLVRDGFFKPPLKPASPSELALFEHCPDTFTLFPWDLRHQGLDFHVLLLPIGHLPRDIRIPVVDVVGGRVDRLLIIGSATGAAPAIAVDVSGKRLKHWRGWLRHLDLGRVGSTVLAACRLPEPCFGRLLRLSVFVLKISNSLCL